MNKQMAVKLRSLFLFSFSSGLPFLLILSTLSIWLTESGVSKVQLGMFAWATIPYTFKFLLAPLIDGVKLPALYNILGQRRSWILFSQLGLIISLCLLANSQPEVNLYYTSLMALGVGLFSAIQDISVEAFRTETLDLTNTKELGIGTSTSVLGYRVGMLCSGAGAIYIADYFASWRVTYFIMAACVAIGIFTVLISKEPKQHKVIHKMEDISKNKIFMAFKSLASIPHAWVIPVFILFFKSADTLLNTMSMPFLLELGFSKVEVAHVAKTFGISAMVVGGLFGGVLLTRVNLRIYLIITAILQIMASFLFVLQAKAGHDLLMLFWSMGVENFTVGMGQVGIIAYLSRMCNFTNTATQYALLSSFASFIRVFISGISGFIAEYLSWVDFYLIGCLSVIPSIFILCLLKEHFVIEARQIAKLTPA